MEGNLDKLFHIVEAKAKERGERRRYVISTFRAHLRVVIVRVIYFLS